MDNLKYQKPIEALKELKKCFDEILVSSKEPANHKLLPEAAKKEEIIEYVHQIDESIAILSKHKRSK